MNFVYGRAPTPGPDIPALERQYLNMVMSMESAIDELRVTRQTIDKNWDDALAVQLQIQGYIDDCKHKIEIAQAHLSHAMMTDEKINEERKQQQIEKSSEPSNNLDGLKLRVKLCIVDGRQWAMLPITQDQRLGLELLNVMPFDNWEELYCSIDRGNDEGEREKIYSVYKRDNTLRTTAQIQRGVMEKLDTVQTKAFEALQREPTTILSLYLYTKRVFELPKNLEPWTGAGYAEVGDSTDLGSLLSTLGTYV